MRTEIASNSAGSPLLRARNHVRTRSPFALGVSARARALLLAAAGLVFALASVGHVLGTPSTPIERARACQDRRHPPSSAGNPGIVLRDHLADDRQAALTWRAFVLSRMCECLHGCAVTTPRIYSCSTTGSAAGRRMLSGFDDRLSQEGQGGRARATVLKPPPPHRQPRRDGEAWLQACGCDLRSYLDAISNPPPPCSKGSDDPPLPWIDTAPATARPREGLEMTLHASDTVRNAAGRVGLGSRSAARVALACWAVGI